MLSVHILLIVLQILILYVCTLYINGDDAIELYEQGVLIETFGDVNVDGTVESLEYT